MNAAIVVHGGAGASGQHQDGCVKAAQAGEVLLRGGAGALEAAVAAVVMLEDDGRFNAGSGSRLKLDGVTIEMDASVMDCGGRLGAVAGLQKTRNPVLVARAVADTPHHLLCGEGALRLARHLGYPAHYQVSPQQRNQYREMIDKLRQGGAALPGVASADFIDYWNYVSPAALRMPDACDTVGAVVRDDQGRFAVAASTGGAAPSLLGRVGDTPIVGSGYYAGPHGAVAATGIGEHIMRHMLAREVYQWLADGMPLQDALQRAVDMFDPAVDLGIIAVSATEAGSGSNREMPSCALGA
ncbi:isoaspartyl peptidase/L-asparaginase [Duganella callida]|uniref:L-asparaginase n=1 Tax=Duganella callida TaxID=2561932 RepID=A0A4Y9T0T6_9BURK|nr:isoaspartyl peptidase/L-asparaginase [Duganella callida]TFW31165.1 L-asparaginase [Duganella callida]